MSVTEENEQLHKRFLQEVWNAGDADASHKYMGRRYAIHHDPGDPGDPWEGKELAVLVLESPAPASELFYPGIIDLVI